MLFPADLATADLAALEAAAPAVHREEYRKTVAAGNRATVTCTDSLGRGDVAGAALSAASMLPIVGDSIGKGGKVVRAAIKHGDEVVDGTKDSARIIKNARQRAVRNAWKQEKEMVEMKGYGTRNWMKSEMRELKETGKVKGYQGHHINNVKDHPEMAGNPNNVEFLNKTEHLESHGGNYRNMTEGPLLNRSVE